MDPLYLWIWRHLPGNGWARCAQALALVLAAALVCCLWLFPAIDRRLSGDGNVVQGGLGAPSLRRSPVGR